MYTREKVYNASLEYFKGNDMFTNIWIDKYCLKNNDIYLELTPNDTHIRLAKEFERIEQKYPNPLSYEEIYNLLKDFSYVIPGGSILYGVGNFYSISSLGNCFVIGNNYDSYGSIFQVDQEQAQLMKRRAGVGHDLSYLRPKGAVVTNAAGTSTGVESFMHRYSNTTREVAQDGRRGALMLSLDVNHPDIIRFITAKDDLAKVTGANISVKISDEFMNNPNKEIWDKIVHQAWKSAEPGVLFWDTITKESIPACYGEEWKETSTNPCFHPDTLIETVEGRKRIKDITSPIKVYSMDPKGKLCIKQATSAFKTKEKAETIKLTLRNGNFIEVTPEHELYVHNKGKVQAKDLIIGDRLIHLSRNRRGKRYSGVKLTTQGIREHIMEHRLVYEACNGTIPEGYDVHHKDGNTFNNSIFNLELLSHNDHSRCTAINDNPQEHQIRNEFGRFMTPEKRYPVKIENVPDYLKTNLKNKEYQTIISIEPGIELVDVYDITVEDTHCLLANNIIASNCGEIPLCPYDSCRLVSVNLYSFVNKPFTNEATFDYEKFKDVVYKAQRLMDDVVDLEEEKINQILNKIENDPEPDEIKEVEKNLWLKIKKKLLEGRRTGLSAIGLADCFAALSITYGSNESIRLVEEVYKQFAVSAYKSSIDMARERGAFPIYNYYKEENNPFIKRLFSELQTEIWISFAEWQSKKYGRRNIALLTIPPSGTISMLAGISSGIEPVYQLSYKRRVKVTDDSKYDFVDQNGDKWREYIVYHREGKEEFYKNSTAYEIDPIQRVKLQAAIQRWVDHSISSTINLKETISEAEVSKIYETAWIEGCKGITIYRDGSRTGVLVDINKAKRPKIVKCNIHNTKIQGQNYIVLIGIKDNKPFEIFVKHHVEITDTIGEIIKIKSKNYTLRTKSTEVDLTTDLPNDHALLTRFISAMLKKDFIIEEILDQVEKAEGDLTTFGKAVTRVLKKYTTDGSHTSENCPECNAKLIFENGCKICKSCGYSRCG